MQNVNPDKFGTPVYLKTSETEPLPTDKFYYLLTRNGLFMCRNNAWFTSCAPAKAGPSDLAEQKPVATLNYPTIPRALFERAVGFFHQVYKAHGWESALILCWNKQTQAMELVCPEQKCSMSAVEYEIPVLPPHLMAIGDLHCHCDFGAFASWTDEHDEMKRPGIHIVVGHVDKEPPEFHSEAVIDGERFKIGSIAELVEDYHQRDTHSVPKEWHDKVKQKHYAYESYGGYGNYSDYGKPSKEDKATIKYHLDQFLHCKTCPSAEEVRSVIFRETKKAGYFYCEKRAKQFVAAWATLKARQQTGLAVDLEEEKEHEAAA